MAMSRKSSRDALKARSRTRGSAWRAAGREGMGQESAAVEEPVRAMEGCGQGQTRKQTGEVEHAAR